MKSRVLIAVATVVIFAAGYFARMWIECYRCKVPPAPQLLGELSGSKAPKPTAAKRLEKLPDPDKVAAQLQKLRPELEAFGARIDELDADMERRIHALLRPDQEPRWDKLMKHNAAYRAQEAAVIAGDGALSPEQIANLQQRPLYKLLAVVVVPLKLDWLTGDLKLDDAQREQARAILEDRRQKFLALIDSSPPPTLTLSRLIPVAHRIGGSAAGKPAK